MTFRHSTFIVAATLAAACGNAADFDLGRFQSPFPEYGLMKGPDGWYLSRQSGPWGANSKSAILFFDEDDDEPRAPQWANAAADESDFYFSDNRNLGCFVSDRANPALGPGVNIWCVDWTGGVWGAPFPLPSPVNTAETEWSPVIAPDGSLYFASDRPGGAGLGDIYRAVQENGQWSVAAVGAGVNSLGGEWNLDISPDGKLMIFEASHRETNKSVSGDLYVSVYTDGDWGPAIAQSHLNTTGSDLMARFIDKETFVYAVSVGDDVELRFGLRKDLVLDER